MKTPLGQKVLRYLEELGCSREQGLAYLALVSSGPQSVLGLSRKLRTGRTKLYPLLDTLVAKQLVVAHARHYGTTYEALPASSLEFLVAEAESKAAHLRSALPAAAQLIDQLAPPALKGTQVMEYRGIDGLKQVNWNLTKAKERFLVFERANLDQHVNINVQFAEKLRFFWAASKIASYDITNNPHSQIKTKCIEYKKHYSKTVYVAPDIFKIQFESYIYNDCVTLVKYEKPDLVAVEIHNADFARQQEQLFWVIWKMGRRL